MGKTSWEPHGCAICGKSTTREKTCSEVCRKKLYDYRHRKVSVYVAHVVTGYSRHTITRAVKRGEVESVPVIVGPTGRRMYVLDLASVIAWAIAKRKRRYPKLEPRHLEMVADRLFVDYDVERGASGSARTVNSSSYHRESVAHST